MPGELRLAAEDDAALAIEWFAAFMSDADAQAGRAGDASPREAPDPAELLRRIRSGGLWFWVDEAGDRVISPARTRQPSA